MVYIAISPHEDWGSNADETSSPHSVLVAVGSEPLDPLGLHKEASIDRSPVVVQLPQHCISQVSDVPNGRTFTVSLRFWKEMQASEAEAASNEQGFAN